MFASLVLLTGCGGDDSTEENGSGEAAENHQNDEGGDSISDSDDGEVDDEDDVDSSQDGHEVDTGDNGDNGDIDTDNGASDEETIEEILGRVTGVDSVKYDMVATSEQGSLESTQWLEGSNKRLETFSPEGTFVTLVYMDQMVAYTYLEGQDYYTMLDLNKVEKTVIDEAESLEEYDIVVIGSEIRDGKDCRVIQYDTYQDGDRVTVKMWIWKLYGLPLRSETRVDGVLRSVFECNDFEFGDIPDSMFEVPSGMEKIDPTQYVYGS
ncbi:MAG: hypothetical protein SVY53_00810 [Chloroflexota bacterium]|nr:hypothetical protein [Chloroflexota bacterium]